MSSKILIENRIAPVKLETRNHSMHLFVMVTLRINKWKTWLRRKTMIALNLPKMIFIENGFHNDASWDPEIWIWSQGIGNDAFLIR